MTFWGPATMVAYRWMLHRKTRMSWIMDPVRYHRWEKRIADLFYNS